MEDFEKLQFEKDKKYFLEMIRASKKIVFFGGAGISTESGIPDFRSSSGIYSKDFGSQISPEEMLSRSYFDSHTRDFYRFYRKVMLYPDAEPNRVHKKLAELEAAGKDITVVTQNIDGLHQKAGSKNVLELHGTVLKNHCTNCGHAYDLNFVSNPNNPIPHCSLCDGIVKPDVVLYEEPLDSDVVSAAVEAISACDMLIIAGTSLVVYPAASYVRYFRGKCSAVINLTSTPNESRCDLVFHQKVGDVFDWIDVESSV